MSSGAAPDRSSYPSAEEALDAAAALIEQAAAASIAEHGSFHWVLAGGSTPRGLYQRLAGPHWATRIDWSRVHLYWGDERCVPPADSASNFGMAQAELINPLGLDMAHCHRMQGEVPPDQAALGYEAELRGIFGAVALPRFDLILLGLGADGHTASLFPGSPVLAEMQRWVLPSQSPLAPQQRLTLTLPVLCAAARVLFLVTGLAKASRVREAIEPQLGNIQSPAGRVRPVNGSLRWILDDAAASALNEGDSR